MTQQAELLGFTADEWQAVGSMATAGAFVIAALAVLVAFLQFRHTREAAELQLQQDRQTAAEQLRQSREAAEQQLEQSRKAAAEQLAMDRRAMEQQREQALESALDQSRPYVLLTVEMSTISSSLLDLVVENVGAGPAFDVKIAVDPPLRRAKEEAGHELANARLFREPVPMLPPRYRLRTFFDSGIDRHSAEADLPDTHDVTIEYNDGRGNSWQERSVLDMTILEGLLFTNEYGVHHAAEALREIRDLLKRSKTMQSPVAVTVEGRDDYLDRIRAEREERERQHEELRAKLWPQPGSGDPEPE
ncbi:hypothetical protein ABTX24_21545 [Nocardioides sp. NPDC127514]|uniref:hypothetical protein n=1 Tax=unclassified Nocardioides TaxID=2615069 RepID=UPI003320FA02